MRRFEVAPGIQITYNDLKMDSCFRPIRFEKDFLQINHCLEGCYECELDGGSVSFLGEGDLCVDYLSKDRQVFLGSRIPLKKYRGITVLLEMETAQQTLDQGFQQAHISLEQIKNACVQMDVPLSSNPNTKSTIFSASFTRWTSVSRFRTFGSRSSSYCCF
ncbi:MAG: hypothetical protein ACLTQP_03740 [Faecalibacterium prausnitzii]